MALLTIYTTKDASMYDSNDGWSGYDDHHPVGLIYGGGGKFRSVVYMPISFTGMTGITSATLWLRGHRSTGNHVLGAQSGSRTLYVRRMTSDWGEGSDRGETLWSSQESWGWANRSGAATTTGQGSRSFSTYDEGNWYSISVTAIVQAWFNGSSNYGFQLVNSSESDYNDGLEFYARDKGSGYKPYLEIVYTDNTAPFAPTALSPTSDALVNTLAPTLKGTRNDPDTGDTIGAYQIQLYADNGTTIVWDSGTLTSTAGSTTFSKVYSGPALTGSTYYKWKARTRDVGLLWGPYSALQRFKTNTPPNPPFTSLSESPTTDLLTLTPTISITHSDNDSADFNMYGYHLSLTNTVTGGVIWDSGDIDTTATPTTSKSILYAGPSLSWQSTYRVTARTKDQNGVWGSDSTSLVFTTHKTLSPISLDPAAETISGLVPTFTGSRASTNDTIVSYRIILYASDQITVVWDSGVLTTGIVSGAQFSKVYAGTALTYGGTYYWKAQIIGSIGGTSAYSPLVSFTAPADASIPVLNLPTTNNSPTNQNITTLTPTLSGSRSSTFTNYQIQLYASTATSSVLGTPIWDSGNLVQTAATSFSKVYNGPALAWGTTYKWRVVVGSPTLGTYTGLATFATDAAGVAIITAPAANGWLTTITPTISGTTSAAESATSIRILLYEANGTIIKWDSGELAQTASTAWSKVYNGPALSTGTDYQVSVRYTKSTGQTGAYSPKVAFRINGAPSVPDSLSPTAGFVFDTLFPTFKAFFNDPDKTAKGDTPASWTIEIRNNATDALIQTKVLTTGLTSGTNTYVWGTATGGADTGLALNVDYKWRTWFVDSKSAIGSASSYQVFRSAAVGVVAITAPTNGSNINTTKPTVTWTFSKTQKSFRVQAIRSVNSTVAYDSGVKLSSVLSFAIPTGYLQKNTENYQIQVTVVDTDGLSSNTDISTVALQLAAPPRIEGLSGTVNEDESSITLDWDSSALATSFITYVIYRRKKGEDDWGMMATVRPESNTIYTDNYPGQSVAYEYRVTVVKLISAEPDLESPDSDIVTARLESDVWFIIGRDRADAHKFELPVTSESHTRPVQQEVFEPLGTNRKSVARGFVLGYEGTIEVTWLPSEKFLAEARIEYLLYDAGPHILKNPFGDVYDVTFGTPDGSYQPTGIEQTTLTWIEVGTKTHNPTLTPDQFLAQIGAT